MVEQIILAAGTCGSYLFFSRRSGRLRRWGYVVGLAGEPAWFYAAATAEPVQWGVIGVTIWTAIFLAIGLRNNWRVE